MTDLTRPPELPAVVGMSKAQLHRTIDDVDAWVRAAQAHLAKARRELKRRGRLERLRRDAGGG